MLCCVMMGDICASYLVLLMRLGYGLMFGDCEQATGQSGWDTTTPVPIKKK